MNKAKLQTIVKNPYFVPVLIGIVIGGGGLLMGMAKNGKTTDQQKAGSTFVELKEKKDLKTLVFGQKEYDLSYAGADPSLVQNIGFFELNEGWQGGGFIDWSNVYEGKSSLGVASDNHQPGIAFLEKKLDLSNYDTVEFLLSINDVKSLESAKVSFGDSSLTNYYTYPISNLLQGWNFVRIPKNQFIEHKTNGEFGWKDINKVQFEIVSRPNTTVLANFDYLSVQKNSDLLNKWKQVNENFLSLGKINDKIALLARNEGALQAVLDGVNGDNFTYQASFIPQTNGAVGLFFRGNYGNNRGYYFLANGLNTSSCVLRKLGVNGWEDLNKSEISNFRFEKDKKYWLRVEARGDKLTGFISTDGESFTELFSANDNEFSSGALGIAVFGRGYSFFDDFKFKQ
jgi:hypothetical protein